MGFPGRTVDLPGAWSDHAPAVRQAWADPQGVRLDLLALLNGGVDAGGGGTTVAPPGQLCATCWVFDPIRTQVLLVRHRRLGWCNPGGHVHLGESAAEAAVRELAEETGLHRAPVGPGAAVLHAARFPAGPSGPAHHHYAVGFAFVADPSEPLGGSEEASWFSLVEPLPPGPDDVAGLVAAVRGALAQRIGAPPSA